MVHLIAIVLKDLKVMVLCLVKILMNVIFEMNGVTFLVLQMHSVKIFKALTHVLVIVDSPVQVHMVIRVLMRTSVPLAETTV